MFAPPTETIIGANNEPDLKISTGVVQAPQVLKTPVMQEFSTETASYKTGENRTPWSISRTGIDATTPASVSSGISAVDSCLSPTPPYG